MTEGAQDRLTRGSAVLVHGLWGNPGDWRWVERLLEDAGVSVSIPDLPSHRSASAGLGEDAEEVRRAIGSSPPPVVAVGLSYGGPVISIAAAGAPSVARLIYVSEIPRPSSSQGEDLSWAEQHPHVVVGEGIFVLDNDWWLNEEAGTTFPDDVVEQLRRSPRRPASKLVAQPQTAAAWQNTPTTVLLGHDDELVSDDDRRWAIDNLDDFRLLETDHFIVFRQPETISQAVIEALDAVR